MNADENTIFLLTCRECGCRFFTPGEKAFYVEKQLNMPKRCKNCREFQKKRREIDFQKVYQEIIDNWSIEARKERQDYFYYIQEVNDIVQGNRYFVVGRKEIGRAHV